MFPASPCRHHTRCRAFTDEITLEFSQGYRTGGSTLIVHVVTLFMAFTAVVASLNLPL